jgi:prepilin-type N-terminal cleavage/methylation domain-containing protein
MYFVIKKRLSNNKGVTLVELIVAILVFSVIMAVSLSLVGPVFRAFEHANHFAEANTLLDNVAAVIIADVMSVSGEVVDPIYDPDPIDPDRVLGLRVPYHIHYYFDGDGILMRHALHDAGGSVPVFDSGFIRDARFPSNARIFQNIRLGLDWELGTDYFAFTLELVADHGTVLERTYTVRPLGMANQP